MKEQIIYNSYKNILQIYEKEKFKKAFLVCSKFIKDSFVTDFLKENNISFIVFNEYTPNPKYEEVLKGIEKFKENNCDFLISIGGGSAIDVSKCINLFLNLDENKNYLEQEYKGASVKHLACPTTAGTGSEANQFAVIYYKGVKQSIKDLSLIPEYVILEPLFLKTISTYQRKSTILDAMCHAIESFWSVNSTKESQEYATKSLEIILNNIEEYIKEPTDKLNALMLKAANLSGKAINITATTSAHAMSYKLTSLYGISHGHAVAVSLPLIYKYMLANLDLTSDIRGRDYLESVFTSLDLLFKSKSHEETIEKIYEIYKKINIPYEHIVKYSDLDNLVSSVNPERLKNNPVPLSEKVIRDIYKKLI